MKRLNKEFSRSLERDQHALKFITEKHFTDGSAAEISRDRVENRVWIRTIAARGTIRTMFCIVQLARQLESF